FKTPGSREGMVVVIEVEPQSGASEHVMTQVRSRIASEHGVVTEATALVRPSQLHRTTSGKIQRCRCRDAYFAGDMECYARWPSQTPKVSPTIDGIRDWLCQRLAKHLG